MALSKAASILFLEVQYDALHGLYHAKNLLSMLAARAKTCRKYPRLLDGCQGEFPVSGRY